MRFIIMSTSGPDNICSASSRHTHPVTALALLVTLGIVFGDIGTSPLYVMKAITGATSMPDADYIIGAVSCVIWTLTLQTTLKYVVVALRADNHGEGGILALFALLKHISRPKLYIVAIIGAAALIADGVITPAMTVTSALEGLSIISPDIPVLPLVIIVITGIFLMQRAGTARIGKLFGPFMLVWFLMLGVLGICSVGLAPRIFLAFNPWYAVKLLIHYPGWFLILGAVFLCTTGAEALYSDLGHCGRRNITISWIFVKAMLILNYLGQGAWIIAHAGNLPSGANPFYTIMPSWMVIPGVIISTGAAIIASQALLSGSFTIFSEAMNLGLWPRQRIVYSSPLKGQLYIPAVNWSLLAGCLLTVLIFRTSSGMEAAYGLAITVTMLMTTVLLSLYLVHRGVSRWVAGCFAAFFIIIEGAFFVANAFKFMHGGWFTILIAGIVAAVMMVWRAALNVRRGFIEYRRLDELAPILSDMRHDDTIPQYASNLIYFSNSPDTDLVESKLAYSLLNKRPKRADHYWILRPQFTDEPDTLTYSVKVLVPQTVFVVTLRMGFRVMPRINVYFRQIVNRMVADGLVDITSSHPSLRSRGLPGDFHFIILHRIFSPSSECHPSARRLMNLHSLLRRLGISDEEAMGLDTSGLTVETAPLIINTAPGRCIEPEPPTGSLGSDDKK